MRLPRGAGLALALAAAALLPVALTAQSPGDAGRTAEDGVPIPPPPRPDDNPVEVSLGVYLIQVSNLDQILQTFEIEGYLEAGWHDERLAFDSVAFGGSTKEYYNDRALEMLGEDVWWPSIEFVNASGGGNLDRHWLTIDAKGDVAYTARFNALVTSSMHLRKFPFDAQSLYIPIESYFHPSSDVVFVVDQGSTGFDPSNSLAEWDVVSVETSVDENDYAQLGEFFGSYSRFVFDIRIERQWGFHLWKVFLPLLVIMACSWTVFWITDLATNVGIAFTILLTVVAFNLAIADTLPKVPYLTFMDAVMVVSYVEVFLSLVVVMVANLADEAGKEGWEDRINRVSRWAFPLGLLVVITLLSVEFLAA